MKANELRIGNWVEYKGSKSTLQIEHSEITEIYFGATNYIPIPLTEEWLLNFGFKFEKEGYKKFRFRVVEPVNYVGYLFCEGSRILREIRYVHQLQNLYFSLTGEELKIK